jgi:hypothetical protein
MTVAGLIKCFAGALISFNSLAAFAENPQNDKIPIKATMHFFYGTLLDLKPYMVSFEDFKNPNNKTKIMTTLKNLDTKLMEMEPQKIKNTSSFGATYGLISRHLRDTQELFEAGVYEYAWDKLNATTGLCIACHTRIPEKIETIPWKVLKDKIDKKPNFRDAEFLFLSHQYEKAIEQFDDIIAGYTANQSIAEIKLSLERKLAFYARVSRNPNQAIQSFNQNLKNKNLPKEITKTIKTWIESFKAWSKEPSQDLKKLNDNELLSWVKTKVDSKLFGKKLDMNDPYLVDLLKNSGILYERLFGTTSAKSDATAEMLYLLAKIEQDLAPIRFYSLADVYFKECITEYSKSPIAKKCFVDYSVSIKSKFGSNIPDSMNKSIEAMERLIK